MGDIIIDRTDCIMLEELSLLQHRTDEILNKLTSVAMRYQRVILIVRNLSKLVAHLMMFMFRYARIQSDHCRCYYTKVKF